VKTVGLLKINSYFWNGFCESFNGTSTLGKIEIKK